MRREILTARPERRVPHCPLPLRTLTADDRDLLADLLYAAYSDSPDSDGETREGCRAEVASFLSGTYGEPRLSCSFVAFEENGVLIGASLVLLDHGSPSIAYLCTRPQWRRRGIGRGLLTHTLNTLHLEHFERCVAQVGVENDPAQHLLRLSGFSKPGLENH